MSKLTFVDVMKFSFQEMDEVTLQVFQGIEGKGFIGENETHLVVMDIKEGSENETRIEVYTIKEMENCEPPSQVFNIQAEEV